MDTMTPIARAVALAGGQSSLARKLGLKPQAVQQWVSTGITPADRCIAVSMTVDWKVTPHDLAPDIYPNPEDGVPPEIRKQRKGRAA